MVRVALSARVHGRRRAAVGLALTTSTLLTSWPQQGRAWRLPLSFPHLLPYLLAARRPSTNEIRTF